MQNVRPVVPERLMDFRNIYLDAFGMDEHKHDRASYFFGVPAEECQRWYEGHPHPTAHRYLQVHAKGYLPYNTNWKDCYIRLDGMIVTPYGNCSPSEIAFLHRNKWASEQTRMQLKRAKDTIEKYKSDPNRKMIEHTVSYLYRLIIEPKGD